MMKLDSNPTALVVLAVLNLITGLRLWGLFHDPKSMDYFISGAWTGSILVLDVMTLIAWLSETKEGADEEEV